MLQAGAVRMFALGQSYALSRVLEVWPDAVDDGLVEPGDPREIFFESAFAGGSRAELWAGVSREDVQRLSAEIRRTIGEAVLRLQGQFDDVFVEHAAEVTRTAVLRGWGQDRYVEEIRALADRFGVDRFRDSWAGTWYRTNVLTGFYSNGVLDRFSAEPTRRLFPYLTYADVRDNRVRLNHRHLHGFTARSTWNGWPAVMPPNGWGCRCRLVASTWRQVRAYGWEGDFPAGSLEQLRRWSGPDPGFAKFG